jgi:hypothetical protein
VVCEHVDELSRQTVGILYAGSQQIEIEVVAQIIVPIEPAGSSETKAANAAFFDQKTDVRCRDNCVDAANIALAGCLRARTLGAAADCGDNG